MQNRQYFSVIYMRWEVKNINTLIKNSIIDPDEKQIISLKNYSILRKIFESHQPLAMVYKSFFYDLI
jgi:hypothetical protein